ncbi:MAG: porin family protein [Bacteroidales bacterium]
MKKILISILLFTAMITAVQTFAQISFGVKGSFNMYNLSAKDADDKKIETSMIPAFDAGVFAEIPIVPEFYFRPELYFATKGGKSKNETPESQVHLSYLVLPLDFLYKGDLSGGKVFIGIGPYIALGVGGKVTIGSSSYDIKFKNDVKLNDAENAMYYKPMDFGGNLMAGYEFKNKFSFAINTSLGLTNIDSKIEGEKPESSTKNVGFGLTLGYRFK